MGQSYTSRQVAKFIQPINPLTQSCIWFLHPTIPSCQCPITYSQVHFNPMFSSCRCSRVAEVLRLFLTPSLILSPPRWSVSIAIGNSTTEYSLPNMWKVVKWEVCSLYGSSFFPTAVETDHIGLQVVMHESSHLLLFLFRKLHVQDVVVQWRNAIWISMSENAQWDC